VRSLATSGLVLALLTATTASFALTEALKLELSPVTAPRFDKLFSPTCACETSVARLSLRLREPATVDAGLVDEDGDAVRTLATDVKRRKGRIAFEWDGRTDAGDVVPDGRYRLRIHLDEQRRTIVIPNPIRVDTAPPELELLTRPQRAFSPDGDERNDRIRFLYSATERSQPLLFVDGALALAGTIRPPGKARILWGGDFGGDLAEAGVRRLWLRARDRAGNLSDPAGPLVVRIRYVELPVRVLRARRGGTVRFRVVTDVASFRWELRGRKGRVFLRGVEVGRKVVGIRLPPRIRGGRSYRLRVFAHRNVAVARVFIAPGRDDGGRRRPLRRLHRGALAYNAVFEDAMTRRALGLAALAMRAAEGGPA
jgi:hypothetical protein